MIAVEKLITDDGAELVPSINRQRIAAATKDLVDGFGKRWIWSQIAWQEIRQKYRGSVLGPFWLTVTTLVMVSAMGVLYSHLLNANIDVYIPYLTTGLVLWQFIAATINDGCETFISMRGVILQLPMPFSIYAYRAVYRNLIALAHNLILVPFVLLLFHVPVNWHIVLFLPGLLLVCLNGVWISLLLGLISARFMDIKPIVSSFLQIVFFVTPVFWPADALGRWKILAELNPLFAAVDITRSPLLGTPIAPYSWWVAIATLLIGSAVSFAFFARFRSRIAYWL